MFEFNKSIDVAFIETMYENEYPYIEEVFKITLSTFAIDTQAIEEEMRKNDKERVRKAIHKIKSAVGFCGMLQIQDKCQQLETKCSMASSIGEVGEEIHELITQLRIHNDVLKHECERLKIFNSRNTDA